MTSRSALQGLVVAERGGRLASAIATTLLAELGATVQRMEDDCGRPVSDPAAWHHHPLALGGKSRVAAGSDATGRWRAMSACAHVAFVSASTSGAAASAAPLTVVLTAAGTDGANPAGSELAVQAATGAMATTGAPGGAPCAIRAPMLEALAGINAAASALAALRAGSTGTLDLALVDSAVALAGTFHPQALANPARRFRNGSRHTLCAPWNAYRTSDGWVTLCVASDDQWRRLAALIGRADLAGDPALATSPQRVKSIATVDAAVTAWTEVRAVADVVRELGAAQLPVSVVRTAGPDVAAELTPVTGADGATVDMAGPLLWLSATPLRSATTIAPVETAPAFTTAPLVAWRAPLSSGKPLRGLRVIDLGPYTAGPLAARYLADLGADVIKVEPPGGEHSRDWLPRVAHASSYFANYNCGKRSVEIDLATPDGVAQLKALLADADVFIQSMKPGSLERLGVNIEKLNPVHPSLITCSISGYGRAGPPVPALDTVVQAGAGLMSLVDGPTDDGPLKSGYSYADLTAAHVAVLGILAALFARDRDGTGQHVDVAMHDALVWLCQLGWPGVPRPAFAVRAAGDGWMLDVPHEMPVGILEVADAVSGPTAQQRGTLRQVPAPGGGAWPVLAPPHRWCAGAPDVGAGVATPGADNHLLSTLTPVHAARN